MVFVTKFDVVIAQNMPLSFLFDTIIPIKEPRDNTDSKIVNDHDPKLWMSKRNIPSLKTSLANHQIQKVQNNIRGVRVLLGEKEN